MAILCIVGQKGGFGGRGLFKKVRNGGAVPQLGWLAGGDSLGDNTASTGTSKLLEGEEGTDHKTKHSKDLQ